MLCCINFLITDHAPAAKRGLPKTWTGSTSSISIYYPVLAFLLEVFQMLSPFVTALDKFPSPQHSLYLNTWCRHGIHGIWSLYYSMQGPCSSTAILITWGYPALREPLVRLPCTQTFCVPETFHEVLHCPFQKASLIQLSGVLWKKNESGGIKQAKNETAHFRFIRKKMHRAMEIIAMVWSACQTQCCHA